MDLLSLVMDLIDTLWNVKVFRPAVRALPACDLIDTLWNVKDVENMEISFSS